MKIETLFRTHYQARCNDLWLREHHPADLQAWNVFLLGHFLLWRTADSDFLPSLLRLLRHNHKFPSLSLNHRLGDSYLLLNARQLTRKDDTMKRYEGLPFAYRFWASIESEKNMDLIQSCSEEKLDSSRLASRIHPKPSQDTAGLNSEQSPLITSYSIGTTYLQQRTDAIKTAPTFGACQAPSRCLIRRYARKLNLTLGKRANHRRSRVF